MVRKLCHFEKEQLIFLKSLPGKTVEHIRRAVDDYIENKKKQLPKATISPSKYGNTSPTK